MRKNKALNMQQPQSVERIWVMKNHDLLLYSSCLCFCTIYLFLCATVCVCVCQTFDMYGKKMNSKWAYRQSINWIAYHIEYDSIKNVFSRIRTNTWMYAWLLSEFTFVECVCLYGDLFEPLNKKWLQSVVRQAISQAKLVVLFFFCYWCYCCCCCSMYSY